MICSLQSWFVSYIVLLSFLLLSLAFLWIFCCIKFVSFSWYSFYSFSFYRSSAWLYLNCINKHFHSGFFVSVFFIDWFELRAEAACRTRTDCCQCWLHQHAVHTHAHARIYAHTCMHARTHTHTHTDYLAAAVIVAVPFLVWVFGVGHIVPSSKNTRVALFRQRERCTGFTSLLWLAHGPLYIMLYTQTLWVVVGKGWVAGNLKKGQ